MPCIHFLICQKIQENKNKKGEKRQKKWMNNYKTKLYIHRWIARQDAVFSKTLLECLTTVSLIGKKKVNHVCLLVLKNRQVSELIQEKTTH